MTIPEPNIQENIDIAKMGKTLRIIQA